VVHILAGLLLALGAIGCVACSGEVPGCLSGDDGQCLPKAPCAALTPVCAGDEALSIRRLTRSEERPLGLKADAALGDVLLSNREITAVLSDIASPRALAPSGGALIDLVTNHGQTFDTLNTAFQAVGILPHDAARYRSLEFVERADFVAAIFRGVLDLRPDVQIVTRYELHACESGLRVRTELHSASHDPLAMFPADAFFWGNRGVTPFIPNVGQGYSHPELDLEKLSEAFSQSPWLSGDAHLADGAAYAIVACDSRLQSGFQSTTLSAVGAERTLVLPGDGLAFERFIAVADGPGQSRATDIALSVRSQLFAEPTTHVSGHVTSDAAPTEAWDERRASLLFSEVDEQDAEAAAESSRIPWAQAVPNADGSFDLDLPTGRRFVLERFLLGRAVGQPLRFTTQGSLVELGAVKVALPAELSVSVTDADGEPLVSEVVLTPAAPTEPEAVRGSVFGQFDEARCSPYLGPPHGGSPACNRVLIDGSGRARFAVPPGNYYVYATRGPFWSLARTQVALAAGEQQSLTLELSPLDLLPSGVLSGDFHVHGGASFDSSLPERDRVLSFVATGVDVIVATDHDVVTDYQRTVSALGLSQAVRVMSGVETTGQVLFMYPPGAEIPRVVGHFNFWPLRYDPALPRNGAPWDERLEPGALIERVASLFDGEGVAQLNHPFGESELGRDTGYLQAVRYDPRRKVPAAPDGSNAGELMRRAPGGHTNLDYDVQEVMNGTSVEQYLRYRAGWFSFLNQGILRAGTANSDSHTLAVEVLGYGRNLVWAEQALASFDADRFNRSVKQGRLIGTNAPVLEVCLTEADGACSGPSLLSRRPAIDAALDVSVKAAPYVPLEELRFFVNGNLVKTTELAPVLPRDPFARRVEPRFSTRVALSELTRGERDCWIVVEVGMKLPPAADLEDDDGLPDTTDNNGDGRIDELDGVGDFTEPSRVSETDVRFHVQTIAPGLLPTAFTNPFLIDVAGDGWTAPELP